VLLVVGEAGALCLLFQRSKEVLQELEVCHGRADLGPYRPLRREGLQLGSFEDQAVEEIGHGAEGGILPGFRAAVDPLPRGETAVESGATRRRSSFWEVKSETDGAGAGPEAREEPAPVVLEWSLSGRVLRNPIQVPAVNV
jgi:hypothetical protein